jgi:hypothetical protein
MRNAGLPPITINLQPDPETDLRGNIIRHETTYRDQLEPDSVVGQTTAK